MRQSIPMMYGYSSLDPSLKGEEWWEKEGRQRRERLEKEIKDVGR